jgi:hypothetical protein
LDNLRIPCIDQKTVRLLVEGDMLFEEASRALKEDVWTNLENSMGAMLDPKYVSTTRSKREMRCAVGGR